MLQARIKNPAMAVPGALEALTKLGACAQAAGIPETTHALMHVRASQINGCGVCLDMHSRELAHAGEKNERVFTIAAWREAPYFSDAERAALALTECVTRLADHADPVPDQVSIATINAWNRLMVATKQPSGEWVESVIQDLRRRA
jgi:AhpD family alkylhydroperoxidase